MERDTSGLARLGRQQKQTKPRRAAWGGGVSIAIHTLVVHEGCAAVRVGKYWVGVAAGNHWAPYNRRTSKAALADAERLLTATPRGGDMTARPVISVDTRATMAAILGAGDPMPRLADTIVEETDALIAALGYQVMQPATSEERTDG